MKEFIEMYKVQLTQAKRYVEALALIQKTYNAPVPFGWVEEAVNVVALSINPDTGLLEIQVEHLGYDANWTTEIEFPKNIDEKLAEIETEILAKIEQTKAAKKHMQEAAKLLKDEEDRKEFERLKALFGDE